MKVLVAYASRHGATAGIAERVAGTLSEAGLTTDLADVEQVADAASYDAFVVGGATYMFHWMKPAVAFVRRHRHHLATHPTWLFSSGPLGTERFDEEGTDALVAARPKEFEELEGLVHPRGTTVFFGAWDPDAPPIGAAERMMRLMPAGRQALPAGDFRDWEAIEAWARGVAEDLTASTAATADSGRRP